MKGQYSNICIKGIASVVPKKEADNMEYLDSLGDKRIKKQIKLTGIMKRRVVEKGQTASDLGTIAAEKIIENLKWNRDEIKVLVFVTQTPDLKRPSTAMLIQKRLNIGEDCLVFDVNLGCSGYTAGIQIVAALLHSVGGKGLLVVGDAIYVPMEDGITPDDLLFGAGSSATAISVEDGYPMIYGQKSDGKGFDVLMATLDGRTFMDGKGVLMFGLNQVADSIKELKEEYKLKEESIDYYIFHQAQKLIINGIANECAINLEKVLNSYEDFGNTSSASIPITICKHANKIKETEKARLFMCGFGIGLSWGSVYVEMDTAGILPIEESDYHYAELEEY